METMRALPVVSRGHEPRPREARSRYYALLAELRLRAVEAAWSSRQDGTAIERAPRSRSDG
jgi:hypothetical protein